MSGFLHEISAALTVVLMLALGAGCDSGSSGGGFEPPCIEFVPLEEPAAGKVTAVWNADSTCGTAYVDLVVSDVQNIWSASFEVRYPVDITDFLFADASGSFLLEGTDELILEAQEIDLGLVEIGLSRIDTQSNIGVTPTTNTLLIQLVFTQFLATGEGELIIEDANLQWVDTPGEAPTSFDPAIEFSGGTLRVG